MASKVPILCGVYAIINTITGDQYIGSARNILVRWQHHKAALKRGAHYNPKLQVAFDENGEAAFALEILEKVKPGNEYKREMAYILARNPAYNISPTNLKLPRKRIAE